MSAAMYRLPSQTVPQSLMVAKTNWRTLLDEREHWHWHERGKTLKLVLQNVHLALRQHDQR